MKLIHRKTASAVFLLTFTALPVSAEMISEGNYTITVGAGQKYGTYSEKIEKKNKQLFYSYHLEKIEDGVKTDELIAIVAEDNAELKPILFNFQRSGGMTSIKLDGTVQKDGFLLIKVKLNGMDSPPLKRKLGKTDTFASLLPLWVKRNEKKLQKGKTANVNLILEDDVPYAFAPQLATVQSKPQDAFGRQTKASLYEIKFRKKKSTWWIGDNGELVKNEYPSSKLFIRKVSPSEAKNFLGQ